MTICRRTSTNRTALANGIRDATVTYMLSTNAIPFVGLLVWLLRSFTPTHIFYIRFSSSFYNPCFSLYIRHKDFIPKGSLTVATICRYCNKPHGMKAGAETHSAWMPREFPNYSCRIFVPSFYYNRQAILSL